MTALREGSRAKKVEQFITERKGKIGDPASLNELSV